MLKASGSYVFDFWIQTQKSVKKIEMLLISSCLQILLLQAKVLTKKQNTFLDFLSYFLLFIND